MLSPEIQKTVDYCSYCPKMCRFACQISEIEKNEAETPWGKQQTLRRFEQGEIELSDAIVKFAYKDLTARSTETFCAHKIDYSQALQELREHIAKTQRLPEALQQIAKNFSEHSAPYAENLHEKLIKIANKDQKDPQARHILFAGCQNIAENPAAVRDSLQLFKKLKIEKVSVFQSTLQCCGYKLWQLGLKNEFADLIEIQFESLRRFETVVVGSPSCAWALKELYPQFGYRFSNAIVTLPEFLFDAMKHIPFRAKPKTRIRYFYHDSCYLGRYLGQFEAPREMLAMVTGFYPEEFSRNRQESLCSGGCGTYAAIEPEYAVQIAQKTLKEMQEREIKTLVSADPVEIHHFKKLKNRLIIKDLVSFLNENLLND